MTDNSPKAVVRRMIDLYNDGTPETYGSDRFLELFSDDAVIELPATAVGPARRGGKEVFREGLAEAAHIFRNRHTVVQEIVADGDRVVARNAWTTIAAVDTPDWKAGSTIRCDYVDFCTVRNGLVVEYTFVGGPLLPA